MNLKKKLTKLANDLFKEQGKNKWSLKRVGTGISILMACVTGVVILCRDIDSPTAQIVFLGFLGSGFGQQALTVIDKLKNKTDEPQPTIDEEL